MKNTAKRTPELTHNTTPSVSDYHLHPLDKYQLFPPNTSDARLKFLTLDCRRTRVGWKDSTSGGLGNREAQEWTKPL